MNELDAQIARLVRISEERFEAHQDSLRSRTDRLFGWLLLGEWVFGILIAAVFSPYGWEGKTRVFSNHLPIAILLGGAIVSLPVALAFLKPGATVTRHTIAVGQALISALLIHLSGGRIETHFHIFGSLAFLGFYRDWKVIVTGSVVVALDHFLRGLLFPESIYGIVNPEWWRFLEHAFWVVAIDVVLIIGATQALREMRRMAEQSAQLEALAVNMSPGTEA